MDTWWLFTQKYSHDISLTVDHSYTGKMEYSSKDFKSHCHDDGIWCVTHGDPLSLEMAIWYKGRNFQFQTMTIGCYVEGFDRCRELIPYRIMMRFLLLLLTIILTHVTLFSASASVHPASNTTSASFTLNETDSVTAAGWKNGDLGLEMTLLRYSIRSTWWLFTREYIHYVDLEVWETYKGNMKYQSKDFNSHCHEDGIWCVNHGDPKSPEVTIWYKGQTYQHNTVSEDCWLGDQDTCQQYNDIVERSRA
ncbi:hypothetical protein F5H01DRAFT_365580 [Linnemannia elongata]|nr:hypothetical protein F5H01DRAFT_365580 [Linnemannia elongata]